MGTRRNKRKRSARKSERVTRIELREIGKLVFVAAIVIVGIYVVRGVEDVPIKTVVIDSPLHHVGKQEVRNVASDYISKGFFTVDLSKFEDDLEEISWVYKANIKRKWPSRLVIEIEEQTPRFRWSNRMLLNKDAKPFFVNDIEAYSMLPNLDGQAGRERYLAELYYQYNVRFLQLSMSISAVEEDARYDKIITLSNGISINVGREKINDQLERCLRSFAEFSDDERATISNIDLRHSNGFAVRWNS